MLSDEFNAGLHYISIYVITEIVILLPSTILVSSRTPIKKLIKALGSSKIVCLFLNISNLFEILRGQLKILFYQYIYRPQKVFQTYLIF